MNSLRIIAQLVMRDIRNPRYYYRLVFCFFLLLAHFILKLDQQLAYAQELGLGINALEPVLQLFAQDFTGILVMGSLIYLVSDAPFRTRGDYNSIYRVGRINWLSSKIIFLLYLVALYILACFLASFLFTLPVLEFGFSYSEFVMRPPIEGLDNHKVFLFFGLTDKYPLMQAVVRSGLNFFLWSTILGMIILNTNMKYHRAYGVSLAFLVPVGHTVLQAISPVSRVGYLSFLYLESLDAELWPRTIAVMVAVIVALMVLALAQVGKHSMHEKE